MFVYHLRIETGKKQKQKQKIKLHRIDGDLLFGWDEENEAADGVLRVN